MMDVVTAIESRRSIRRFKPDPIKRETIEQLLDLTIHAPSAKNDQPWRFVVTTDNVKTRLINTLQTALEEAEAQGIPTGSMRGSVRAMAEAPVVILIFNRISRQQIPEHYKYS